MSNKSKMYKKARETRQEKQAKSVIKWLIITLSLLAIILLVWAMYIGQ